jgi:hypothetical protein
LCRAAAACSEGNGSEDQYRHADERELSHVTLLSWRRRTNIRVTGCRSED